jgi:lipoprotein signal peptidase
VGQLHSLEVTLHNTLATHLENIYSIVDDFDDGKRTRRAWFPFLGDIISTISGVATTRDVDSIKNAVKHLETMVLKSSHVFSTGRDQFLAAMKINSDRISNLADLIQTDHDSINVLHDEIKEVYESATNLIDVFAVNLDRLSHFVISLNELDTFKQSVEQLLGGKLPHDLITHSDLSTALTNLRRHLFDFGKMPKYRIIHNHLHYYYLKAKFVVVRSNQTLIVIVDCPLTLNNNALDLFEFRKIPLHVKLKPTCYSELNNNFYGMLYHVDEDRYFVLHDRLAIGDETDLYDPSFSSIHAYSQQRMTCALAILRMDYDVIKKYCEYHIVMEPLTPHVYALPDDHYLLSNISNVTVECGHNITYLHPEIPQIVFELHCGCFAVIDSSIFLPKRHKRCDDTQGFNISITPKYVINLPLLHEFFEPEDLTSFRGDGILSHDVALHLPDLTVAEQSYKHKTGIEKENRFHLFHLINQTKENNKVYGKLSQYVFNDLLKIDDQLQASTSFSLFSTKDWVLAISTLLSVISFIIIVFLVCKLRQLFLALALLKTVRAYSFPTVLRYGMTTPMVSQDTQTNFTANKDITMEITQNLHLWLLTIGSCILIVMVVIIFFYKKHSYNQNLTQLCLEVGNPERNYKYHLRSLVGAARFYKFEVFSLSAELTLESGFLFDKLRLKCDDVVVRRKDLHFKFNLDLHPILLHWTVQPIRKLIMSEKYYLTFHIVDSVGSEIIVLRNPFSEEDEPKNVVETLQVPIYPDLSDVTT